MGELPEGLNRPAGIDAETVPAIGAFAPKPATLRSPTYYDHWAAQYPKVRDQLTAHNDMREVRILVRGSSVALL